ncbi:DUF1622 domain-containing protein [Longispora albida]|uniref:DUF1622 domain-containing protein n=1 Tax=Longispora albida TaxID=203523 RepID=UPI000367AE61|nr:DUF1622 domain-containing protein [Longispora albida]
MSARFTELMEAVATSFEGLGAAVLAGGVVWACAAAVRERRAAGSWAGAYRTVRRVFGSALLLSLEVLVAADLIRTVAVAPTLRNVGVLGLIVAIRTFLSFSLQVEIEGTLPWRRSKDYGPAG